MKNTPQKTFTAIMNVCQVNNFLSSATNMWCNSVDELRTFKKFIRIEETKPYDQLTDKNTFVSAQELREYMPAQLFREMECVVVTCLIEQRWIVEIKPINSVVC